jgi:PleD family two-component response regulator
VIRAVGEIMRNSVANAPHAVTRYGGGEFAILPPQTALNRALICRANAALYESKNVGRDRVSCG